MIIMKKIVPFNNTLEFNTDVKEITAISLEHEINKHKDIISGVFYINGEYKITEGVIDAEQFSFELPFDIALSDNYKEDTLLIDIDDFRYELIADKKLKVNIDLSVDNIEELIEESGLSRKDDFYICNTVKCRPPENRVPTDVEKALCERYLTAQIDIMNPQAIIFCGATSLRSFWEDMLRQKDSRSIRGLW